MMTRHRWSTSTCSSRAARSSRRSSRSSTTRPRCSTCSATRCPRSPSTSRRCVRAPVRFCLAGRSVGWLFRRLRAFSFVAVRGTCAAGRRSVGRFAATWHPPPPPRARRRAAPRPDLAALHNDSRGKNVARRSPHVGPVSPRACAARRRQDARDAAARARAADPAAPAHARAAPSLALDDDRPRPPLGRVAAVLLRSSLSICRAAVLPSPPPTPPRARDIRPARPGPLPWSTPCFAVRAAAGKRREPHSGGRRDDDGGGVSLPATAASRDLHQASTRRPSCGSAGSSRASYS